MTVSTTANLSILAEMMGNDYTESNAADFAQYLLDSNVTDTDDVTDQRWGYLLEEWSTSGNAELEQWSAYDWFDPSDRPAIAIRFTLGALVEIENAGHYEAVRLAVLGAARILVQEAEREGVCVSESETVAVLNQIMESIAAKQ